MSSKHKYGAKSVVIDGHKFPSLAEGRRYQELKLMLDNGVIQNLELQPRYKIRVNDMLICTYVGDFRYWDNEVKQEVVEDVKGYVTDVYKIKRKLLKAVHGIDVQEVRA